MRTVVVTWKYTIRLLKIKVLHDAIEESFFYHRCEEPFEALTL